MIATIMTQPSRNILRPIVVEAARGYGSPYGYMFSSAYFSFAVKQEFDLAESPGLDWCNDVLIQLPYVVPLATLGFWRYEPAN